MRSLSSFQLFRPPLCGSRRARLAAFNAPGSAPMLVRLLRSRATRCASASQRPGSLSPRPLAAAHGPEPSPLEVPSRATAAGTLRAAAVSTSPAPPSNCSSRAPKPPRWLLVNRTQTRERYTALLGGVAEECRAP